MSNGKHASDEGFNLVNIPWKTVGIVLIVIIAIIGLIFGGKTVYSSFVANKKLFQKAKVEETNSDVEEDLPSILYGYKVLGNLKIESKNYSKYILDAENDIEQNDEIQDENQVENEESASTEEETSSIQIEEALKKGLVKLYGQDINSKGNFCIIGHNNEDNFAVLNELEINDKFSILDSNKIEKNYIITDIYTIEPTDLKCLMPNEKYTEVTLITCTSGSNQRLVVKALEENDYNEYKSSLEESTENTDSETENSTIE